MLLPRPVKMSFSPRKHDTQSSFARCSLALAVDDDMIRHAPQTRCLHRHMYICEHQLPQEQFRSFCFQFLLILQLAEWKTSRAIYIKESDKAKTFIFVLC